MLKKLVIIAVLFLTSVAAYGLADTAAPTKIQIPFANGAGPSYVRTVPITSQIGIQNGAASYTDGFPPLNFTPVNAGGVPPFGQDMNGILRDVSAHARWWAAGGPVYYDSAYQTAIGGYPKGALVQSTVTTGLLWVSTTENNVTNPDTGGAGWVYISNAINAANSTTQAVSDNSTKIATTAFVQNALPSGAIIPFNLASCPTGYTSAGIPADYSLVQASGNLGTQTVGAVIAHTHTVLAGSSGFYVGNPSAQGYTQNPTTLTTSSTGGSANLAAGVRVIFCIKN